MLRGFQKMIRPLVACPIRSRVTTGTSGPTRRISNPRSKVRANTAANPPPAHAAVCLRREG
jgi:hypothetical protein